MERLSNKIPVGILGATGMVGQRFVLLLENHPWFEVVNLAASENSAGKSYVEAVAGKWAQSQPIPTGIEKMIVGSVGKDIDATAESSRLVFCAIDAEKEYIKKIEEAYAARGVCVVSNNSAHRWTEDVPMIIPEVNPEHLEIITTQRNNRGWDKGCIVVKPNCSIQSYVPLLHAWKDYKPTRVIVSTYQAISGAGKIFESWPEMVDNVIPYIGGEEEKSENEPLKVMGQIVSRKFELAKNLQISANCIRVSVTDGHMAAINVEFLERVTKQELIQALESFKNPLDELNLPSAPKPFLTYFEENDRPQTRLDRDLYNGMAISVGRIREDFVLGWKCVALSHNTIRGAAGGGILNAELLVSRGLVD